MVEIAHSEKAPADTPAKRTRRDAFFDTISSAVPWQGLSTAVASYCSNDEHPLTAMDVERMLRIHFAQRWFGLADRDCEDTLIDSAGFQRFAGLDNSRDAFPDADALQRFRALLNAHGLANSLVDEVNRLLSESGISVSTGAISEARVMGKPAAQTSLQEPQQSETRRTTYDRDAYGSQTVRIKKAENVEPSRMEQMLANVQFSTSI